MSRVFLLIEVMFGDASQKDRVKQMIHIKCFITNTKAIIKTTQTYCTHFHAVEFMSKNVVFPPATVSPPFLSSSSRPHVT